MPKTIWLILLCFATLISSQCLDNCNGKGLCENEVCVCERFYDGENCSERWRDDETWFAIFMLYTAMVLSYHTLIILYSTRQLIITFLYWKEGRWVKWSIVTWTNIIILCGSWIRVIAWSYDPHSVFEIASVLVYDLALNVPLMMWLCSGFMMFLYWIELERKMGVKELLFLGKLRPVLIFFIVTLPLVILPLSIWDLTASTSYTDILYNGAYIVILLSFLIIATFSGYRLAKAIRNVSTNPRFGQVLRKLHFFIWSTDIWLLLSAITLVVYIVVKAPQNRWPYTIFHIILRTEEFGAVMSMLLFLSKKIPNSDSKDSQSTNVSSPSQQI